MKEKPDGMAMFIRKWDDIDNIVRFFIIIYVLRERKLREWAFCNRKCKKTWIVCGFEQIVSWYLSIFMVQ